MIDEFEMINLRELHYFFDAEFWQKEDSGVFMSQTKYTWDILKKFKMLCCNPMAPPLEFG